MLQQENIEIGTPGIRRALDKYDPERSIAELIWNGFDAGASLVSVEYQPDALGGIQSLRIVDNGSGIARDHLAEKFKPFLYSNKVFDPDHTHFGPSAKHGKNGMGRLTFFTFASKAVWTTTYDAGNNDFREYEIVISANTLKNYEFIPEKPVAGPAGTSVELTGIYGLSDYSFGTVTAHLIHEFAWFLELGSPFPRSIVVNAVPLDYKRFVGDRKNFDLDPNGTPFNVRYVRWNGRLNSEYSRYYFIGSDNRERAKKPTSFNNKGDDFYHSVYVQGSYFDHLEGVTILSDTDDAQEEQPALFLGFEREETFKELIRLLADFLSHKRSPFLRKRAVTYVNELESEGAFPSFGPDVWEQHRKRELVYVVRDLYEADPRIFSNLSNLQKQTLVRLFSLVMDSSERDNLLDVLAQVVHLSQAERASLARTLQSTTLSNIVATIKLIEDRYVAVEELKSLVHAPEFGANERDHLQTHIERHYWLFGEQYHLVTAAEPDFEEALRRFLYVLRGEDEKVTIDHPEKKRQMDVFAVRRLHQVDRIDNIVLELKHPEISVGKKELNQVKDYMDVILGESQFNASNMSWDFYLVGNSYDEYIEREMESAKMHGQQHIVFNISRYRIFVMKWSELTTGFELRHNFILEKLKLEREKLAAKQETADDIIAQGHKSSAAAKSRAVPVVK